jgi:hypothetical protein
MKLNMKIKDIIAVAILFLAAAMPVEVKAFGDIFQGMTNDFEQSTLYNSNEVSPFGSSPYDSPYDYEPSPFDSRSSPFESKSARWFYGPPDEVGDGQKLEEFPVPVADGSWILIGLCLAYVLFVRNLRKKLFRFCR